MILGHPINMNINNSFSFTSWRLFVLICGLPSLFSFVFLYSLPETPKYLIARNKFEDAKKVFKKVFVWNTGKEANEYPVCQRQFHLIFTNIYKSLYFHTYR